MRLLTFGLAMFLLQHVYVSGEETELSSESFLEQIQGEWELESLYKGETKAKLQKTSRMKVEGNIITLPEGIGDWPYKMEQISVDNDKRLVFLTLVSKLGSRTVRWECLASIEDGKFTLAQDQVRSARPKTIQPDKNNLVRTWKRTRQKKD